MNTVAASPSLGCVKSGRKLSGGSELGRSLYSVFLYFRSKAEHNPCKRRAECLIGVNEASLRPPARVSPGNETKVKGYENSEVDNAERTRDTVP